MIFIILLIGGSASAYGLWINSKYNGNTNVACKNDLTWIKVFSIAVASSLVLIVASVPGPNDHPLTSCFGALASMTTIFLFIWQCYGLQVWFHQPICNVAEVHSFGLIFTWIFIVINSLLCLCACCAGCVALSMTGWVSGVVSVCVSGCVLKVCTKVHVHYDILYTNIGIPCCKKGLKIGPVSVLLLPCCQVE